MKKTFLTIAAFLSLTAPSLAFDQWQKGVNVVTCEEVRWQSGNLPQAVFSFRHKTSKDNLQAKLVSGNPAGITSVAQSILIEACAKYDVGKGGGKPDLLISVDNIFLPTPHIVAIDWVSK